MPGPTALVVQTLGAGLPVLSDAGPARGPCRNGRANEADRDKAHADADARHREALAAANAAHQALVTKHTAQLLDLLQQNTELTRLTQAMSQRIEALTSEMHGRIVRDAV